MTLWAYRTACALLLCWAAPSILFAADHTITENFQVTVFRAEQDGYNIYRFPTIVKAANGDLLAITEGRKNSISDHGDIDIVMKRSVDSGHTWSALQLAQDEWSDPTGEVAAIGNPAPVVDMTDPLHLGRICMTFCRNNYDVFTSYSENNGTTWFSRVGTAAYSDLVKLDGSHAGCLFESDYYNKITFSSVDITPEPRQSFYCLSSPLAGGVCFLENNFGFSGPSPGFA